VHEAVLDGRRAALRLIAGTVAGAAVR
jgi:hypothetical protein